MHRKPELIVYTASAGSGKTYTLTRDFIAFALSHDERYFRHVLAITFTRKATKEMKDRIVTELQKLSSGASSKSYLKELETITHLDSQTLQYRAQRTLVALLTDYTALRVRTIDSFFEEIIRSFASEIGYSTRYKIELDAETRLHRATLQLLSNLGSSSHSATYTRVQEIVKDAVAEGKKYNVTGTIESLGKKLFAESSIDQQQEGTLPDNKAIVHTRKALETYQKKVKKVAQKRGASLEKIYNESANYILEQLSVLGTLADIQESIREMGRSSNSMLLHSSQSFIQEIIQNSDTPFIYERVGTRLNHYLIDEFQDTSRLQFYNLRPLIANSLANGYSNLVVGDVKQSIYKFRHCDRTILNQSIFDEFKGYTRSEKLEYNWRSSKEIVEFNNHLFTTLPSIVKDSVKEVINKSLKNHIAHNTLDQHTVETLLNLPEEITQNYEDVVQKVPKGKEKSGGIEIKSFHDEETFANDLPKVILDLVEKKGYSPGDIAILCYKNKEVASVASILLQYAKEHPDKAIHLRFTGSEALHLTNSLLVGFIIELFRALNAPENTAYSEMARFRYSHLWQQLHSSTPPQGSFETLHATLQNHFTHLSLYDLTELVIKLSKPILDEEESPYIMMFLDLVSSFSKEEVADLYSFLYWWDEKGHKSDLPAENISNAIRLLTLHKSKGLEFPIVLLPFPTWDLGLGRAGVSELLRVRIPYRFREETGCSELKAAYVRQVSKLVDTVFIDDYYREMVANLIDRLNLFYVATTRAEVGLILWLPSEQSEIPKPTKTRFPLIYFIAETLKQQPKHGETVLTSIPSKIATIPTPERETISLPSLSHLFVEEKNSLRIRLTGKDHFKDNEQLKYGSIMHELMSRMATPEDCSRLLEEAAREGKVTLQQVKEASRVLEKAFANPLVASWFSPNATVFSEQAILSPRKLHFSRPDRVVVLPDGSAVVIDYKFGKKESHYSQQVRNYCKLIEEVGYNPVEGFLLYLCQGNYEIEKVYPC